MLRSVLLTTLLVSLTPVAFADPKITSPAAGASIPAGQITIKWEDSGDSPKIADLSTYTIQLMVGGNTDDTAQPLLTFPATPPGEFSEGNSVTGTVSPGVASSVKNGFYLKMMSVATEGGQVINYSKRFTMTGMDGLTPDQYLTAAKGVSGTDGPDTVNQVNNDAGAANPAAAATGTAIPYGEQSGLTKYAPMQPIPPTKITKKNFTPLNPTSKFTIATTWLPNPTILSTITASQTFSVTSRENPASPQSHPTATGDMAKFLNRWKD